MRSFSIITAIGLFVSGCSANYAVIKQATPNPVAGAAELGLMPIEFAVETSDEIKEEIVKSFNDTLKDDIGSVKLVETAEYSIKPVITLIAEGTAINLVRDPTKLNMTVQIVKGEEVVDEIQFAWVMTKQSGFSVGGIPMSGYAGKDRLGSVADEIAEEVAGYIDGRTAAAGK